MKPKDYLGPVVFVILTFAAFVVGTITNKDFIIIAGYLFIVMAQVAYLIAYTKSIKEEVDSIKQLLIKK